VSTDHFLVCYTCKSSMPGAFSSSSIAYGYVVWDESRALKWLGSGQDVGNHEGHDLRIVGEDVDLPWMWDGDNYLGRNPVDATVTKAT
jgi:hypothetical protein